MTGKSCRSSADVVWPAMRALAEGMPPTPALLGEISGRRPETIARVAAEQGWRQGADTAQQRSARIAVLLDQTVDELEGGETDLASGRFDKARIDALAAMIRMLEKLSEINESRQARQEEVHRSDAETAEILRRIDERIVELAREFARELVGDDVRDAAGDAADRGRVVA